jgi:hypothetical protein
MGLNLCRHFINKNLEIWFKKSNILDVIIIKEVIPLSANIFTLAFKFIM